MHEITIADLCDAVKRFGEINAAFSNSCLTIEHERRLVQHIEKLEAEVARLQGIVERAAYSALEPGE
jgi:uncharacterized coiled-coil DUF342 family protein